MGKRKASTAFQGELFTTLEEPVQPAPKQKPHPVYQWQLVTSAHKGMVMVVMSEDVKILAVREDEDCVYLAYADPETGKKTEQLYNNIDSIYVKQKE